MTSTPAQRVVVVVGLAALIAAVAWWARNPAPVEPPPRFATAAAPAEAPLSTLTIPVTVDLADLAAQLDTQVPTVLADVAEQPLNDTWSSALRATRPGPVTVRGDEGALVIGIPLVVKASAWRSKRAARRAEKGKDAPEGAVVDLGMVVELRTVPELTEDWHLRTATAATYRWTQTPTLSLGPIDIPIKKPVEKALDERFAEIGPQIDAHLAEQDTLRLGVERAWTELSTPRPLGERGDAWLVGAPTALYASDLVVEADRLALEVGLVGRFSTRIGPAPAATAVAALPARTPPTGAPGFRLSLPIVLGWDAMSASATDQLAGQTWVLPGADADTASLRIDGVSLYPSGDQVAAGIRWTATHPGWTADGVLYLLGRPTLDPAARTVVIEDFDYVLDTWDTSIWSANALAESGLEAAIRDRLAIGFGAQLDAAVAQANASLAAGEERDGNTVTGQLDDVGIDGLTLTEDALVIDAHAAGLIALEVVPRDRPDRARPTVDLKRPEIGPRRGAGR